MTTQNTSVPVPGRPKRPRTQPAEDVRSRWAWTEASVWTDRMLTALEQGVKGGKWFRLIDKVWSYSNLYRSYVNVARNGGAPGVDHVTIKAFDERIHENLKALQQALREQTYAPQAVRRTWIPKAGSNEKRPLGIPTVRDRTLQTGLRNVLEPIFERDFAEHSYGFRPGRGCKDALRRVEALLKGGYTHIVDADLKSYFDTIPHDRLMQRIREKVADGRVLALVEMFLKQGVMEGLALWTPEEGTPQGAVISPLLANIYLDPLDHLMAEAGFEMVRYADDFVILCRTREDAERAREMVQNWTAQNGLTLHPTKTRIASLAEGFDFLGYHFEARGRWPRKKSLHKLKDTLRAKTKRNNGRSLPAIIQDVNRTLRGWFGYFKHSNKWTFPPLDGWIRKRLRSILRKRAGRKGPARGLDHRRWPNAYFAKAGLFNLTAAHAQACQSSQR